MTPGFWVKRFIVVTAIVFAVLMVVELLKGHEAQAAVIFSAVWSVIAAAIFTGARIYHSRRGRHCAICGDTAESPAIPKG